MPRARRLHLPRAGFHITARTQDGKKLFTPEMRDDIVVDIEQALASFGHQLLAHVVMPNHVHIVLKQGDTPLGWAMQRIMQKAVNRVRRTAGGEGHVFGRPYWSSVCGSAAYLRRAIVYAHLNPCAAGLCANAKEYPWSTHNRFLRENPHTAPDRSALHGLMLFAHNSMNIRDVVARYEEFVNYCVDRRRCGIPGDWLLPEGPNRFLLPCAAHGDSHWAGTYSTFNENTAYTRVNVDVTAHATLLLKRIDPELNLDWLRANNRSRTMSKIRRQLIAGLVSAGCRSTAIARCLRVSASLVSTVASQMRFSATRQS